MSVSFKWLLALMLMERVARHFQRRRQRAILSAVPDIAGNDRAAEVIRALVLLVLRVGLQGQPGRRLSGVGEGPVCWSIRPKLSDSFSLRPPRMDSSWPLGWLCRVVSLGTA